MREPGTFEEKVGRVLDTLFDGARLLTGEDEARAEALLTRVVVESARAWPRQERRGAFSDWIVSRMVRSYMEHLSEEAVDEESREQTSGPPAWPVPPPEAARDALLEAIERLEASDSQRLGGLIRDALGELPVRDRAAVWLVSTVGLSYRDAGAALGLGERALANRLVRARRELQARLARSLGTDDGLTGRIEA